MRGLPYNNSCVAGNTEADAKEKYGVWLSLARAPGLGPGGRRFESCHPDLREQRVKVRACMRT